MPHTPLQCIFGKILKVARNVYLSPQPGAFKSHFFAGPKRQPSGIAVQWWTTWITKITADELAHTAILSDPRLSDAEESRLSALLLEILQEAIIDNTLFDIHVIFLNRVPTLFDALVLDDKLKAAEILHQRWITACLKETVEWLVVYPLQNTEGPTANIGANVSLLNAGDAKAWARHARQFPSADELDVQTGTLLTGLSCFVGGISSHPFTWIVCQTRSTADGGRKRAANLIRTFLAVALSFAAKAGRSPLLKGLWAVSDRSMQFASSGEWSSGGIGPLMPQIIDKLVFSPALISEIQSWFANMEQAPGPKKRRLQTASQFLHQALLEREQQQFIYYFIALDALFGERGKVEQSIQDGIGLLTNGDRHWRERFSFLFDLRSALVHGDISAIHDWKDFNVYRKRFCSEPLLDTEAISLRALREYSI